jgi:hypothetical protein
MTKRQFAAAYGDARREYKAQVTRARYERAIDWLIANACWFSVDLLAFRTGPREYPNHLYTRYPG